MLRPEPSAVVTQLALCIGLDLIADALPGIRRTANVDALVSMWDDKALANYPGADRVDVTPALVDAFQPTERQRKTVEEIRKKKPLPASALRC